MSKTLGPETVGERIRRARRQAGLTQPELADRIGRGLRTVVRYERGGIRPPLTVLRAIAQACDLDPLSLLEGTADLQPAAKEGSR